MPRIAERVGERVVFLAGPFDPEDVVEEELVAVRGCEPPELEVGAVEEDASQRADLGIDVERGHVMIVSIQRLRA